MLYSKFLFNAELWLNHQTVGIAKLFVSFICIFIYSLYIIYLNKMKDEDIIIKILVAGILMMSLTRYVIFDDVLSYKFVILSCILVIILGYLWYRKRKGSL